MGVDEATLGIYRVAVAKIADLIRSVTVEHGSIRANSCCSPSAVAADYSPALMRGTCRLARNHPRHRRGAVCLRHGRGRCIARLFGCQTHADAGRTRCGQCRARNDGATRASSACRGGIRSARVALEWIIEMRYRRQVHQVGTPLPGSLPVTSQTLDDLAGRFRKTLRKRRYGHGSSYRAAGIELVTFRLKAHGMMQRPRIEPIPLGSSDPSRAERGRRLDPVHRRCRHAAGHGV